MEDDKSIITIATVPAARNAKKPLLDGEMEKKKKKRGAFGLLKASMFMVRRGANRKSKPIHMEVVASKGMFNKLVGSMRPLHLQDNQSPPSSVHNPIKPSRLAVEQSEAAMSSPLSLPSPQCWSSSSSSVDSMSRYGSAPNLQELDKGGSDSRYASAINLLELDLKGESDDDDDHDDDECDGGLNNNAGDEMIDAKAEEFIAQFYKQMKLQHRQPLERY